MARSPSHNVLSRVPNPFHGVVVQDVWQPLAFDVSSIQRSAFEQCLKALDNVSQGKSDSLLIYGSPGAGKTHLISRLQQHLFATAKDAPDQALRCVFVAVRLQSSPTRLWQYLRQRLASDLLRQEQGVTQLQRLVAHQIAAERNEPPRKWVVALRVLTGTEGESVSEHLQRTAERLDLDRDVFVALDHLVHRRYAFDATAWLKGDSLPEAVLEKLGVGKEEDEEREDVARRVVTALCRLAGETLPIVFCFDQLESLQRYPKDVEAFFRFGRMAADLADADPNVLIISCIQSVFVEDLKVNVREADRDRAIKRHATLEPLTRDQIELLVRERLDRVAELQEFRVRDKNPVFPLEPAFLDELFRTTTCTPRKIIARCAERFEELKTGGHAGSNLRSLESMLESEYLERRRTAIDQQQPGDSTATLTHGLPIAWFVFDKSQAFASLEALEATPADVVLRGAQGDFGVAICNECNMTSLAARFRRLLRARNGQPESGPRPVLMRHAGLEISHSARRTREYLGELKRLGYRFIQPTGEALAALEAARSMMSDARSGDLSAHGETVQPNDVASWLRAYNEPALGDLLAELEREQAQPDAALAECGISR